MTVRSLCMPRFNSLLWTCLGSVSLASQPCLAGSATAQEAVSGESFFSCGQDANVVPSYTDERGQEGRVRQMVFGNQRDDIPDFQQLRMLPSLTMEQRRELKDALLSTRDQMQVLFGKLKQLRPKDDKPGVGNRPGAMPDPQARTQAMQLRTQIQELRKKSWEQIKPKLTEAQLKELASMRKGELQPATFNEPMTGGDRQ